MRRNLLAGLVLVVPALAWGDGADVAKLDSLNAGREDPAVQKELNAAFDAAVAANPNDYGVLWRAARNKFWLADGTSGDSKKNFGKEAWDLGERAAKVNPNGVEGHYFAGIGLGAYSQAVGILNALTQGLEGKFNAHIDAAMKLDPGFAHCGPLVAKGRYYYELPWPKRDLGKSADLFNKTITQCPENIRAYVYLADTLLKDGKAKLAKEALGKMPTDAAYEPGEAHRALGLAKKTQADVDKELK